MIKESDNLTGQEAQRATPKQKWWSQMLPYIYDYLDTKYLRFHLIPSRNVDDKKNLAI